MITILPNRAQQKERGLSESEQIERGEFTQFKSQDKVTLSTENKTLDKIVQDWESNYESYKKDVNDKAKRNETYWKGDRSELNYILLDQPVVDNLLFDATETFLPQATATNPDPVVTSVNEDEYINASKYIRNILENLADTQVMQQKLKQTTRNWVTAKLGVVKVGWDFEKDEIETKVVRMQSLILDKDATIDESGRYTGEYIGHNRVFYAYTLKEIIKKADKKRKGAIEMIDQKSGKKDGTKIPVKEYWTKEMVFWVLDKKVIARMPNPHFNFDEIQNEETIEEEDGATFTISEEYKGINHFKTPEMPFIFLSVFNLGLHPHDDTNPFEQNLSKQDTIDRRQYQIEDNVLKMNNSIVFGGKGLSKDQAAEAFQMLKQGNGLWFPPEAGNPNTAVANFAPSSLPADVYRNLQDMRAELRSTFSTSGLSSAGLSQETTVRGKILSREADTSKIGGTITTKIEQVADAIFNWWVQLIFVYYDQGNYEKHLGVDDTQELMKLLEKNSMRERPIAFNVSVKNGSMIPKDPLTKRNEAIELATAGLIDPLTLFERLDDPDPRERARRLIISKSDPARYMAEILDMGSPEEQAMAEQQQLQVPNGQSGPPNPATQLGAQGSSEQLVETSFNNIIN